MSSSLNPSKQPMIVRPRSAVSWLGICTLLEPVSHHDPDRTEVTSGASPFPVFPFRRRAYLVTVQHEAGTLSEGQLDRCLDAFPVPVDFIPDLSPLTLTQFLAVAVVKVFVQAHRSEEGIGLFSGPERYHRLSSVVGATAQRSEGIHAFWSSLLRSMQVGSYARDLPGLLAILALPRSVGLQVLITLAAEAETSVLLAREWVEVERLQDPVYAEKARRPPALPETDRLSFTVADLPPAPRKVVRAVPAVSGNSVRHLLVREPGMLHLLAHLGIDLGTLSPAVGELLSSGRGLKKGARAPSNEAVLGAEVVQRYPFLELVSGSVDLFLLPPGVLRVNPYLVCLENERALAPLGIQPDQFAEALIDQETLIKFGERGGSLKPFGFEMLVPGAQVVCEFTLTPYASPLAIGALAAALTWAKDTGVYLGGNSARGYGAVDLALPDDEAFLQHRHAYEVYLAEHQESLRSGLLDGTLGTANQLCATEAPDATPPAS